MQAYFGFLLLIGFLPFAHADSLHIPQNIMFDNPDNYGLFIRDDVESMQLVRLVSDSGIVSVPDSLFLDVGENHAIFDLDILDVGESKIVAHVNGEFYEASTIISKNIHNDYSISLILPESTSVSEITGVVYLIDDFDRPILAQEDIEISFVTTNIKLKNDSVVITANNSHAFFSVQIYGDATISAFTKESISNVYTIDFRNSEIEMKIGIAPDIITENSFAYLFVWFVDEFSAQFMPYLPITATVHTSDNSVLGFDASFTQEFEKIYITDGVYHGRIDTYNQGEATVTVNVPGYGSASQTVTVGVVDNANSTEYASYTPNYVKTAIYPSETISDAWLVWSLYYSADVTTSNSTVDDSSLYPMYGDGYDFFITSDDIKHTTHHTFESKDRYTQSNIIPLSSSILGQHQISVTSPNFEMSDDASFDIVYPVEYQISVTPLPFIDGVMDSLFTITVLDPDGFVIDPHYVFGDLTVSLISQDIEFEKDIFDLREPVTIISGLSQIKFPTVTVISDKSNIVKTLTFGAQKTRSISIQIPEKVHVGEEFPVYAYLLDENQTPVVLLNNYLETKGCSTSSANKLLFKCDYSTEFLIFGNDVGFASKQIEVFTNTINPSDMSFSDIPDEVDLDSKIAITINIHPDATFQVITEMPYEIQDNTIFLNPEFPGTYNLDVLISRKGYQSVTEPITFDVTDFISLPITTQSSDVVSFPASVTVTSDGEIATSITTPDTIRIKQGHTTIKFPKHVDVDSVGYVFEKITIDGRVFSNNVFADVIMNSDSITADYRIVVSIRANDAIGSGIYDFGETVILAAPSRDVAWFLIQDVFDYWEFMPNGDTTSETVVFVATESFETTAIYKESHVGLILVVMVIMVVLFALKFKKQILEKIPLGSSATDDLS